MVTLNLHQIWIRYLWEHHSSISIAYLGRRGSSHGYCSHLTSRVSQAQLHLSWHFLPVGHVRNTSPGSLLCGAAAQRSFVHLQESLSSHLRRDDVKQISRQRVLLSEDVVVVRFEGDAVHVDDERAGRQVEGDAVLSQEALQLGGLLSQELQRHFRA